MKRYLAALFLCGCGASGQADLSGVVLPRTNAVRVLQSDNNTLFNGERASLVVIRGYDNQGQLVFGPDSETHDDDMTFAGLPHQTTRVEVDFQRGPGRTLARFASAVNFPDDLDGVIEFSRPAATAINAGNTFTVKVVNNSDYPDDQVFLCVLGKDRDQKAFYYLEFGANDQNTPRLFGGKADFAKYSGTLSRLKPEGPHAYSFQCPYEDLVSGRIYLSFGKKLEGLGLNNLSDPLSLATPSASGAPDFQTLFEFMELSATSQPSAPQVYTLFANTSVVDFFSMGLGMELDYTENGANLNQTVGFVNGARDKVLAEFAKSEVPAVFNRPVLVTGTNKVLRILAPVQGVALDPNGPISSFLASAIDSGWLHYGQTPLNISDDIPGHQPYGYRYTGQLVNGPNGSLNMTCVAKPPGDTAGGALESLNELCRLPKPSSRIVFFCDDPENLPPIEARDSFRNDGSQGHKRLGSLIGAALNRGVFENYADWGNPARFYTRPDGKFNWYAKIMHQFALDGKVYGFGYDDVYGQDPTLARPLSQVNQVVINIPHVPRL